MISRLVERRPRWLLVALVFLIAAVLTLTIPLFSGADQRSMLAKALTLGNLASLPASATGIRCDGVENVFTAQYALRFEAEPSEIDVFLDASPALKGIAPEQLSTSHQYVPYEETVGDGTKLEQHAVFHKIRQFPWFVPVVREKGRRFEIPQDRRAVHGEVIVDDQKHVVYVLLSRS